MLHITMSFVKQTTYSNINECFSNSFPSSKFKKDKRVKQPKKIKYDDITQKPMFNMNNNNTYLSPSILDGRDLCEIDSSEFNTDDTLLNGYNNESNYSYVSNKLPKRSNENKNNTILRDIEIENTILRPSNSRKSKRSESYHNTIESHHYQYIDPTDTMNFLPRQGICTRTQNKSSKIKGYNRKIY